MIAYRDATLADAPAIADLFARSFTATFGHLYPTEDLSNFLCGCDATTFAAEIADTDHYFRLAEDDGVLVGFIKLGPPALPIDMGERKVVELRQLYLDESAKGQGIAQALVDWALDKARAMGCDDVYLTVYIDNHRARRLYERYGFEEVGQYAFMVGNTVDDDRIMRLKLR